jgi:hypothetical protein
MVLEGRSYLLLEEIFAWEQTTADYIERFYSEKGENLIQNVKTKVIVTNREELMGLGGSHSEAIQRKHADTYRALETLSSVTVRYTQELYYELPPSVLDNQLDAEGINQDALQPTIDPTEVARAPFDITLQETIFGGKSEESSILDGEVETEAPIAFIAALEQAGVEGVSDVTTVSTSRAGQLANVQGILLQLVFDRKGNSQSLSDADTAEFTAIAGEYLESYYRANKNKLGMENMTLALRLTSLLQESDRGRRYLAEQIRSKVSGKRSLQDPDSFSMFMGLSMDTSYRYADDSSAERRSPERFIQGLFTTPEGKSDNTFIYVLRKKSPNPIWDQLRTMNGLGELPSSAEAHLSPDESLAGDGSAGEGLATNVDGGGILYGSTSLDSLKPIASSGRALFGPITDFGTLWWFLNMVALISLPLVLL